MKPNYQPDIVCRRAAIIVAAMMAFVLSVPAQDGDRASDSTRTFTPAQLSEYNGLDGHAAYVAVNGKIYDVSALKGWMGGRHHGHYAGTDLTNKFGGAPHGAAILADSPVVGVLVGGAAPTAVVGSATLGESSPTAVPAAALSVQNPDAGMGRLQLMKTHKKLAYTTAGLLVAADIVGAIHFASLINEGHDYRDSIGFSGNSPESVRENAITDVWSGGGSQVLRATHGVLIAALTATYTATATIELVSPRNESGSARHRLHRKLFYVHAALLAANIGLGFAESTVLSKGNHKAVIGLGAAHIAVGIAAPIVITASGLTFAGGM